MPTSPDARLLRSVTTAGFAAAFTLPCAPALASAPRTAPAANESGLLLYLALLIQAILIAALLAKALRWRQTARERSLTSEDLERYFGSCVILLGVLGSDGRFVRVNQAWQASLGYSPRELTGMRYSQYIHPDDLAETQKAVERVRAGGQVSGFVNRCLHKDGSYRVIEWDGFSSGGRVLCSGRDVTEAVTARAMLAESEERFRTLLDTIDSVSVQGYSADGVVSYWNRGSEILYGYSREEALGKNLVELIIPPPMRDEVRRAIRGMGESGRAIPAGELTLMRKDGSPAPVLSSHAVVRTAGGESVQFCMDVDISRLKQAEEEMAASLEEKKVLLREIHHRVKNNLQIISSLLSLQEHTLATPEARAALADSRGRVTSMAMIHEQLYRSNTFAGIDVKSYLEQLLSRLVNASRAGEVELRLEARPVFLILEQAIPFGLALNELVTNAIKHGFDGRDSGRLRVAVSLRDAVVEAEVENDGHALAENFDPFESPTLGMRLVTSLAGQLKGEIFAGPGPDGNGAAFVLRFPLARP